MEFVFKNAPLSIKIEFIKAFKLLVQIILTTKNDNIYTCIINFLRSVHNSKFENEIFSFLFNTTNSDNDMIRFRCCHLLNILFQEIDNEDEEFEEIFFDELIKSLRPRLRDITSNTQIEAISTLYRLQDWGDDCKIIKDFLSEKR